MKKFVYLSLMLLLVQCTTCAKTAHSKEIKSGVALTYANDKMMDGAGAQLQRIYGIYAVSRYLHLPYVHTPLKAIGYQGLSALEKNNPSPNAQDAWNRVFTIPSD